MMRPLQLESDTPESVLQELQALRHWLKYKEEEDHLDTDVTMQDETVRNTDIHNLPTVPVLMVVKCMSRLINDLFTSPVIRPYLPQTYLLHHLRLWR